MVGVVLVGVVRVYAMGVVGRDQQRALDRPAEGVAFRQQAAQYLFEERTVGAAMRTGTDFLVVGADQDAVLVAFGVEQGFQAGVAGQQVVQARPGDELVVETYHRGGLGVVERQLVVQYHVGGDAVLAQQLFVEQQAEVGGLARRQLGDDRRQFVLRVDRPTLVGGAVEMDGQVGDYRDGLAEVDQAAFQLAIGAEGDAPGQRQVAVEPGGEEGAAIDFDAELEEAVASDLRVRLDPQAGAVGVRADQAEAAFQGRATAQADGDQRRVVTGHVVAAAGFGVPGVALVEAAVAGGFQAAHHQGLAVGVERRDGGAADQLAGEFEGRRETRRRGGHGEGILSGSSGKGES